MPKDRSIYSEPRMASTQKKQDFPVDKIMFLIEYNSMLRNRDYVNKFTKEEQPEFGFTDDPVILQFEESNANAFKLILEDEFKDSDDLNTFNELSIFFNHLIMNILMNSFYTFISIKIVTFFT